MRPTFVVAVVLSTAAALVLVYHNAASQDADNPAAPDGGTAAAPPDAGTGEAPQVAATVPADGETGVEVLIAPSVHFDADLDVNSVSDDSLILRDESGARVDGEVRVGEDGRSIELVPASPLRYGETYTLEIAPARGLHGEIGEAAMITFTTSVNALVYSFDVGGEVLQSYRRFAVDGQGRLVEFRTVIAPGDDGRWLTGDDLIAWRTVYQYDGDVPVLAVAYDTAGGDGVWLTADDTIRTYDVQRIDNGLVVDRLRYDGPGDDGRWFTDDDRLALVWDASYRGVRDLSYRGGQIARVRHFDNAGADGVWFTDDDHIVWETDHRYNYAGRNNAIVTYMGPGDDGTWETNDDVIGAVQTRDYAGSQDAVGPSRIVTYGYPGADGLWLTADDMVVYLVALEYSSAGDVVRTIYYSAPGSDGEWFTGDDVILYHVDVDYDDQGLAVGANLYRDPGQDGTWLTEDDRIAAYLETGHDSLGDRTVRTAANHPGVDNLWLSADDLLTDARMFNLTR